MDIREYIPTGKKNAVTRGYLRDLTGLSDRELRRAIQSAREDTPIINLSDGSGYFVADNMSDLRQYVLQERNRRESIDENITAAEKFMEGDYVC